MQLVPEERETATAKARQDTIHWLVQLARGFGLFLLDGCGEHPVPVSGYSGDVWFVDDSGLLPLQGPDFRARAFHYVLVILGWLS